MNTTLSRKGREGVCVYVKRGDVRYSEGEIICKKSKRKKVMIQIR